jgi:hypothetical protein
MQESLIVILILLATIVIFIRLPFFAGILSLPYRLVIILLRRIGWAKDPYNWSVVYDSQTKTPIDPAYITVRNMVGVEIATMITDLNGRFALILPRGLYVIDVQKTNYVFPSAKLNNVATDGRYKGLYYGGTLEIRNSERAVSIAVPMDPIGTDWNQTEKKRKKVFLDLHSESYYRGAESFYVLIGLFLTLGLYISTNNYFYKLLMYGYGIVIVAILLSRIFQPGQYAHSLIVDKKTKQPVPFARVTVFRAHRSAQIMRKVATIEGQVVILVSPGKYYVTIEKRDDKGVYSLAYKSSLFHVYNGTIGKRFKI